MKAVSRIVAVFTGVAIAFSVPIIDSLLVGEGESLWPFYLMPVAQCLGGAILSFLWPHLSWRVGFWMFLIWPLFLLVGFALTAGYFFDGNVVWKDVYAALLFVFSMLPAGIFGGWLGATISKNRQNKLSMASSDVR